jgi:hypothetical protein
MRFEGDELPCGQRVVSGPRGTGASLERTPPVRGSPWLLLFAAGVTACGGGSPASPTFIPTSVAEPSTVADAADAGAAPDVSLPGDGSTGSIAAAFASTCATSPATGSFPADVATVLTAKCQTCHADPPKNGAPFELLTYEDVHMLFDGTIPIYQEMYFLTRPGASPHMPFGNAPQLTPDEFATLSDWLISCAPPGD